MAPIRKGDGTAVDPQGVSEVRKGDGSVLYSAIPDSVVYQYPVRTFGTSTWTDNIGSADMSVNGMTAATFSNGEGSISGDGADDFGKADGPQNLPQNEKFGVAFTFQTSSAESNSTYFGAVEGGGDPGMYDQFSVTSGIFGNSGDIEIYVQADNGGTDNRLWVYTDGTFDDGTPHAVIINKNGNSASDINIYVDDMSSPVSTTIEEDKGFDHTQYSDNSQQMGFYALNRTSGVERYIDMDAGVFEFNSARYTATERQEFVSRRPEV